MHFQDHGNYSGEPRTTNNDIDPREEQYDSDRYSSQYDEDSDSKFSDGKLNLQQSPKKEYIAANIAPLNFVNAKKQISSDSDNHYFPLTAGRSDPPNVAQKNEPDQLDKAMATTQALKISPSAAELRQLLDEKECDVESLKRNLREAERAEIGVQTTSCSLKAAVAIQSTWRIYLSNRKFKQSIHANETFSMKDAAAVRIQALARGYCCRQVYKRRKAKQSDAINLESYIQSYVNNKV